MRIAGRRRRSGMAGSCSDRRHRRPAQAPPRGALRRPAAARRRCPGADLKARGCLRGRADGQPRLVLVRPGARAASPLGRRAGADRRDRHARSTRCVLRGPGGAPRRRQGRSTDTTGHRRGPGPRADALGLGARVRPRRYAISSPASSAPSRRPCPCFSASRWSSGTLLINESVNRSFDNLFGEVNAGVDVTVRDAEAVEDPFEQGPQPGFEARPWSRSRASMAWTSAEGVIADTRISILGTTASASGLPGRPSPHCALDGEDDAVQRADDRRRAEPDARTRSRSTRTPPRTEDFEIGDTITDHRRRGRPRLTLVGIDAVRLRRHVAWREPRSVHAGGGAAADRQGGPLRRDRRRCGRKEQRRRSSPPDRGRRSARGSTCSTGYGDG